jgi:sialate O-acetylesterase
MYKKQVHPLSKLKTNYLIKMNKNIRPLFSTLCAVLLTSAQLFAEIKLPAIFSNNMVLQRETDVAIWGTADKNATVSVITSWNDKKYDTKAAEDGRFKLKVSTPKAGGPYKVTISDGAALTLDSILIGEVWLCSGQSNMQMPVRGYNNQPVIGSLDAILESENPNLRLFNVGMSASPTPNDDFKGTWKMAEPETTPAFSATAYFYGRLLQKTLKVPVGLIVASWGGTTIQPWMNDEACKEFEFYKTIRRDTPLPKLPAPKMPTSLFNAMINPMVGYGIRGAIWYQGESNKWEPEGYQRMFPAMIKGWRKVWEQGDFPFYYAQCAPHGKNDVLPNGGFLREAQLKTLTAVPNVGMASTMDLGEQFCIHPSSKEEGSKRLAYLALSETYGIKGISPYSPVFKDMTIKNDTATLFFDKAPDGFHSSGKELSLFEIAGADKVFYPAKATIVRDNINKINIIIVKSESVPQPVAVRYAFKNFVVGDLKGNNGLPVSSFRTDDWVRDK